VYVKFKEIEGASKARQALHNRWFAGKPIGATFMVSGQPHPLLGALEMPSVCSLYSTSRCRLQHLLGLEKTLSLKLVCRCCLSRWNAGNRGGSRPRSVHEQAHAAGRARAGRLHMKVVLDGRCLEVLLVRCSRLAGWIGARSTSRARQPRYPSSRKAPQSRALQGFALLFSHRWNRCLPDLTRP